MALAEHTVIEGIHENIKLPPLVRKNNPNGGSYFPITFFGDLSFLKIRRGRFYLFAVSILKCSIELRGRNNFSTCGKIVC